MGGPSKARGFSPFGTVTALLRLLGFGGLGAGFVSLTRSFSDCEDSSSESMICRFDGRFFEPVLEGESSTSLPGALTLAW